MAAQTKLVINATLLLLLTTVFGCGVKGKPLPPIEKTFIGNGLPKVNENLDKKANTEKSEEKQ